MSFAERLTATRDRADLREALALAEARLADDMDRLARLERWRRTVYP